MKKTVSVLALTFGAWGCGPENEGGEARASVQALVTAESGVPGGEEFVVEVNHEDNVPSDEARRLAANIRVRKVEARADVADLQLNPRVVRPANLHWMIAEEHDIDVQVIPVHDEVNEDDYEWEWVDEGMVFPHCPEGSHGIGGGF